MSHSWAIHDRWCGDAIITFYSSAQIMADQGRDEIRQKGEIKIVYPRFIWFPYDIYNSPLDYVSETIHEVRVYMEHIFIDLGPEYGIGWHKSMFAPFFHEIDNCLK